MKRVLYSYALDANRKRRSIAEVEAPRPFRCGDCDSKMVPKRGNKNRWHFAHKANVVCTSMSDPDNALHRYAQDIILESFEEYQSQGREYLIGVQCPGVQSAFKEYETSVRGCEGFVAKNAALPGAKIRKEVSLVPNTRSDLVVELPDNKAIIIEVVNTHPPEEATRESYKASPYPVVIKNVSWDTLDELSTRCIANETINVPPDARCARCRAKHQAVQRENAEREASLKRRMKAIDVAVRKLVRHRNATPKFRPWYQVYKSNWTLISRPVMMYPKIQRQVFANAVILTELGFLQRNAGKPHLFSYVIRQNLKITLYADLGGSDVVPIYEDTAAMLYIFGLEAQHELEQYTIDRFSKFLQMEGVNVRAGFESSTHIESKVIDPTGHVPHAILIVSELKHLLIQPTLEIGILTKLLVQVNVASKRIAVGIIQFRRISEQKPTRLWKQVLRLVSLNKGYCEVIV